MIEAVADHLEGAPRQLRRRWSDEFKAQVVMEALEPGASVSAIARRIGIHPSQLFAWRRDARAERQRRNLKLGLNHMTDEIDRYGPLGFYHLAGDFCRAPVHSASLATAKATAALQSRAL
ncbi:hypothetical protein ACVIHH_000017 [Bradyrhizobium sp. USDA 4518]